MSCIGLKKYIYFSIGLKIKLAYLAMPQSSFYSRCKARLLEINYRIWRNLSLFKSFNSKCSIKSAGAEERNDA